MNMQKIYHYPAGGEGKNMRGGGGVQVKIEKKLDSV